MCLCRAEYEYVYPLLFQKYFFGYKYIIRVFVVTLPCAPSRSDFRGLSLHPTQQDHNVRGKWPNVLYVLG